MRLAWAVGLLLMVPLAMGAVTVRQDVRHDLASQAAFAQITSGSIGSPSIGASKTSATVNLNSLPLITANDILRLDSTDATWNVRAELVSQTGWSVTESITISLADGILTRTQIVINLGVVTQTTGQIVDLPVGATDTLVRVVGTGTGSVVFDLVLKPDAQAGPTLRYRVTLNIP